MACYSPKLVLLGLLWFLAFLLLFRAQIFTIKNSGLKFWSFFSGRDHPITVLLSYPSLLDQKIQTLADFRASLRTNI
jgi:hypothetical protein